jgi:hypothetical protein
MSKEAAVRAMREARYAERTAGAPAPRPAKQATRPQPPKKVKTAKADAAEQTSTDGLCGHRSMNGRTCTREAGHAAKSHRYS